MAEGKKCRKLGRNSARPSQKRYQAENHLAINKSRRAKKAKKAAAPKEMRVPRGTARYLRRHAAAIQAAATPE